MIHLPYLLATLFAVGGGIELARLDKQITASAQLQQGDSETRVLEVLGEPKMRCPHGLSLFTLSAGPPQWIYGTNIDVTKIIDSESTLPNLLPLKFRIFSADEGDLVINWDDQGHVASIQRPKLTGR
jgi:hypothetical protein